MKTMDTRTVDIFTELIKNQFTRESNVKKQRLYIMSAVINELGGSITISNSYHGAGIKIGRYWKEVKELVLADDSFELFFKDAEGNLYEATHVEEFHTDIFGEETYYDGNDILYFISSYLTIVVRNKSVEINK